MHWLEVVIEALGELCLNLRGIRDGEEGRKARTAAGCVMLLLLAFLTVGCVLFVRARFFSK